MWSQSVILGNSSKVWFFNDWSLLYLFALQTGFFWDFNLGGPLYLLMAGLNYWFVFVMIGYHVLKIQHVSFFFQKLSTFYTLNLTQEKNMLCFNCFRVLTVVTATPQKTTHSRLTFHNFWSLDAPKDLRPRGGLGHSSSSLARAMMRRDSCEEILGAAAFEIHGWNLNITQEKTWKKTIFPDLHFFVIFLWFQKCSFFQGVGNEKRQVWIRMLGGC